jgi:hypothetical protein
MAEANAEDCRRKRLYDEARRGLRTRMRDGHMRLTLALAIFALLAWAFAHGAVAEGAPVTPAAVVSWSGGAPTPPGPEPPIVVSETECPDAVGCTDGTTVWVRSFATVRAVEHERGHIFDLRVLTNVDRAAFAAIVGRPWDAEWFADAYASCRLARRVYPRWAYSVGDGLISGANLHRICLSLTPGGIAATVKPTHDERTNHAR